MHLLECRIIITPLSIIRGTSRGGRSVVRGKGWVRSKNIMYQVIGTGQGLHTHYFNVHNPERLVSFLFADAETKSQEME